MQTSANLRAWLGVGEDYFGFVFDRSDFAGEGDGLPRVAEEVPEFFCIIGEDDAREGTGFVLLTEIEKDRAGFEV